MKRVIRSVWPLICEVRAAVAPVLGEVGSIHARAMTIPGWINGDDARAMVRASLALADDPVIVEVGVFMGRSTALLAEARRLRGNGRVYCIDPFDCSGDDYSTPIYAQELHASKQSSLERTFMANMKRHRLLEWIELHKGSSEDIARGWTLPIDLLLLDADYSVDGARAIFHDWTKFLKPGGMLLLPNTNDRAHAPGHDGSRRIVVEELIAPRFKQVRTINELTLAEKA